MKYFQWFKIILPAMVVSLAVFSCSGSGGADGGGCQVNSEKVDVNTFQTLVTEADSYVLLDVRTPEEFAAGHLDGAMNLNFFDGDFKQKLAELDREKPVYVYCKSGNRSGKSAVILKEMCFKTIKDLDGGIMAWTGSGNKTVR